MGVNFTGGAALTGGSSGFLSDAPIGSIIQVVYHNQDNQVSSTSTSWYAIMEGSITPKAVNSKILLIGHVPNYSNDGNSTNWSNAAYLKLSQKTSGGSYSRVAQYEHPGPKPGNTEFSQCIPVTYMSSTVTQGTQYYFEYAAKSVGGGDTHYWGRHVDGAGSQSGSKMTLIEIAQ